MSVKYLHLFLMLVLISSCGKGPLEDEHYIIPLNIANSLQSSRISTTLSVIESDLKSFGIDINLRSIPTIVMDLDGESKLGVCVKKKNGDSLYIAISSRILNQPVSKGFLPPYFHTILHEVGHCFFNRVHEETLPDPLHGKGQVYTVMNTAVWFLIPEVLRKYYVGEIAGIGRVYNDEDLERISREK